MKTTRQKKTLALEKIKIAKLENPNVVVGGAPTTLSIPVYTYFCTQKGVCQTTTSTITDPVEE